MGFAPSQSYIVNLSLAWEDDFSSDSSFPPLSNLSSEFGSDSSHSVCSFGSDSNYFGVSFPSDSEGDFLDDAARSRHKRKMRVAIIRSKRNRPKCASSLSSSSHAVSPFSSSAFRPNWSIFSSSANAYEQRRRSNRESAEASRRRKQSMIDSLTTKVCESFVDLEDLLEEQSRLLEAQRLQQLDLDPFQALEAQRYQQLDSQQGHPQLGAVPYELSQQQEQVLSDSGASALCWEGWVGDSSSAESDNSAHHQWEMGIGMDEDGLLGEDLFDSLLSIADL